jgi:DNA-binding winged helix-turn-helix (wHTH) protein
MEPTKYKFGAFELEEERRQLLENGEPVLLNSRSFDVLVCLVKNAGRLVPREDLFSAVWGDNSNTGDEVLTDAMSKLRAALKDDEKPYCIIKTVPRKGYQFIAAFETNPAPQAIDTSPIPAGIDIPNRTFGEWLRNAGKKITLLFSVLVVLSVVLSFSVSWIWGLPGWGATETTTFSTSVAHVLIMCIAIVYGYLFPGTETFPAGPAGIRRAALSTMEQYKSDWMFLLFFWGLLYMFRALTTSYDAPWMPAVITGANNINTLLIYRCFNTLNRSDSPAVSSHNNIAVVSILYCIVIIGAFFAEVANPHYSEFLKLSSGVFAGVAMALFFGRFQSKFLKSPQWLLILLYFYVAIQPLFVYFDRAEYATIIIPIALFLKCLLILYMFWLFESRRLLFYLVRVRRTDEQVDEEYKDFYMIWDRGEK